MQPSPPPPPPTGGGASPKVPPAPPPLTRVAQPVGRGVGGSEPGRVGGLQALLARNKEEQPKQPEIVANYLSNMWMWGHGGYYRLSQGDTQHRSNPVRVKTRENDLHFVEIACGAAHILGRCVDGSVYSWGKCHVGQLGHGLEDIDEKHPKKITKFQKQETETTTLYSSDESTHIVKLGCGVSHILLIEESGNVYTNGIGYFGTLGHGNEQNTYIPKRVEALKEKKVVCALGGGFHSVFLTSDGLVYTCGKNEYGQLGHDSKTTKIPSQVLGLPEIRDIFVGENCVFALSMEGKLWAWGENSKAQLGIGNQINQYKPVLLEFDFGSPVVYISCGAATFAITEERQLYCWGQAIYTGLGYELSDDNINFHITQPKKHTFFENQPIKLISVGEHHTIVLTTDNLLWTWGENTYGKLGDGTVQEVTSPHHPHVPGFKIHPIKVEWGEQHSSSDSLQLISTVGAGSNHSMILKQ